MNETSNAPTTTVWPTLAYADARAAIRFLVEAFGFVEMLVVPGERDDRIDHAVLLWPDGGGIMLSSTKDEGEPSFGKPGGGSVYIVTDSPDALFERATAHGAEVLRDLRDEDYGSRGFSVLDPEGNAWSFGTYRGT